MSNQSPQQARPDVRGLEARGGASGDHHPVVLRHAEQRAGDLQLRLADAITRFAGTMTFVYIHAVAFALWMLVFERSPWPTLTLVVSLEAIFLSTFVMIGQNRQAAFQQAKADHDFVAQEQELQFNTRLTEQVHELARQIHARVVATEAARPVDDEPVDNELVDNQLVDDHPVDAEPVDDQLADDAASER